MIAPLAILLPFLAVLGDDESEDPDEVFARAWLLGNPKLFSVLFKNPYWDPEIATYRGQAVDALLAVASWVKSADSIEEMRKRLQFYLDIFWLMKDQGTISGMGYGPEAPFAPPDQYSSLLEWAYIKPNGEVLAMRRGNVFGGPPIFELNSMSANNFYEEMGRARLLRDLDGYQVVRHLPRTPVVSWDEKQILIITDGPSFTKSFRSKGGAETQSRPAEDDLQKLIDQFSENPKFIEGLDKAAEWFDQHRREVERELSGQRDSVLR